MKYQMDNWLGELQEIIKNDKDLKCNAGYAIAVYDLVRIGIEDGGMRVRDIEELEEHIYYFKDMMREHYMI